MRRIKQAARSLFLSRGYDKAAMRDIARLADVGIGTLFRYAEDKRDLLFLAYADEHEQIVKAVSQVRPSNGPFLADLVVFFREIYQIFAKEPEFTRYMLREGTFYISGTQAARTLEGREAIVKNLERLVADARRLGQIASPESDKIVARLLFGVFQVEVRRWLASPNPTMGAGMNALKRMLGVVIAGLQPSGPASRH